MTSAVARGIVDTLLPGDATLPGVGAAGIDLSKHAALLEPIESAAVRIAGGKDAFIGAGEVERTVILQAVQKEMPDAFAALLAALLPDYYEAPAVIAAFGWPARPPQPEGHHVPGMDQATRARLEKVRLRRKIWRDEA